MLLLSFIKNNSNWAELLKQKFIRIKYKGDLAIFNYDLNLAIEMGGNIDFTDPLVKECRGIIIDLKNMKVVCFPFNKFGNYTEYYADNIDWNTARVQEKIDGSIVKLYYYKFTQYESRFFTIYYYFFEGKGENLWAVI